MPQDVRFNSDAEPTGKSAEKVVPQLDVDARLKEAFAMDIELPPLPPSPEASGTPETP